MPEANVKLTRRMRAGVSTAIARILRVLVHLASCPLQQNTFIVNYE